MTVGHNVQDKLTKSISEVYNYIFSRTHSSLERLLSRKKNQISPEKQSGRHLYNKIAMNVRNFRLSLAVESLLLR